MRVHRRFDDRMPATTEEVGRVAFRVAFGDRTGATIFLAAVAWFGCYWRFGFFSTDQLTFVNTLVGVADGHLHVDRAVYGPPDGATPGTNLVDGRVYGRNYGVVVVSAVWLWLIEALAVVVDLRILLTGAWSLAVLGATVGIGRLVGRPRAWTLAGTVLAAVVLVANLLVATPLPTRWLPLLALQLTTAAAAALVGVVLYRLVRRAYGRRIGLFAGVVAVVGTPVGFWASLPKRHSVSAALVVFAMYTLYRSRAASSRPDALRFRALTYAWCGLAAWVHAAEGLLLLLAVAVVDLPTARSSRPRDLLAVGAALFASLLPFFLTNALISGNPLRAPRLLPRYSGGVLGVEGTGPTAPDAGATGPAGGDGVASSFDPVSTLSNGVALVLGTGDTAISRLAAQFEGSFLVLATDPTRTVRIFVRSGYVPSFRPTDDAAVNLSVLASMPLLGAVVAVPALAAHRLRDGIPAAARRPRAWSPLQVVDAFTILYVFLLLGLFLRQLPIHHMVTVRYLHPLYAVGVYWLVRLPAVRRALRRQWTLFLGAALATLLLGVPLYLGAIDATDAILGEAVQLYALAALGAAAVLTAWSALGATTDRHHRTGAVALGICVGAPATFLLVSGLSLFPVTGDFLLPGSRVIAETVHYARLFGSTPPF